MARVLGLPLGPERQRLFGIGRRPDQRNKARCAGEPEYSIARSMRIARPVRPSSVIVSLPSLMRERAGGRLGPTVTLVTLSSGPQSSSIWVKNRDAAG